MEELPLDGLKDETRKFIAQCKDGGDLVLQWHRDWQRVWRNANGISGYARVVNSDDQTNHRRGGTERFHICAYQPCRAKFNINVYTRTPPPTHCRFVAMVADTPPLVFDGPPPRADLPALVPADPVCKTKASKKAPEKRPLQSAGAAIDVPSDNEAGCGENALPAAPVSDLGFVLKVAREIRREGAYVGQSAFLLLALMKNMRVYTWEGEVRVDLVSLYAPWALERCVHEPVVDAIFCTLDRHPETGERVHFHVSDETLLNTCNHWVAGLRSEVPGEERDVRDPTDYTITAEEFYQERCVALLDTEADGNCGPDVMCMMCGVERTPQWRSALRKEVSDFLFKNAENPLFQESLRCCQEGPEEPESDGDRSDKPGHSSRGHGDGGAGDAEGSRGRGVGEGNDGGSGDAGRSNGGEDDGGSGDAKHGSRGCGDAGRGNAERGSRGCGDGDDGQIDAAAEELAAVRWACNVQRVDDETVRSICQSLPRSCVQEQVEKYKEHLSTREEGQKTKSEKPLSARMYASTLLSCRFAAAQSFIAFGKKIGVDVTRGRLPYGVFQRYLEENPEIKKLCGTKEKMDRQRRYFLRAVATWKRNGCRTHYDENNHQGGRADGQARFVRDSYRKRLKTDQGSHRKKAPGVRQELFAWFSVLRHSIDYKVFVRFPPKLLDLKAKELVNLYCAECLKNGVRPNPPQVTSGWLKGWQCEYRVSLRKPNRKFKVPRRVLFQRVGIFFLNVIKVRKLALLALGYDLEFENADQSPFHKNEAGPLYSMN